MLPLVDLTRTPKVCKLAAFGAVVGGCLGLFVLHCILLGSR